MNYVPSYVRPGGKSYVNPEGMIHCTDGKLRWVYEIDQRKTPTVLLEAARKYVTLGAVIGALILLVRASTEGTAALLGSLPVLLAVIAAGAVAALASFGAHLLQNGPFVCLVFTMDEDTLSCQQIRGKTRKEQVTHAFAVWVGGQSQPAVRVCGLRQTRLDCVRAVAADPTCNRIRLRGAKGVKAVFAEPQLLPLVLDGLKQRCTRGK